MSDAHDSQIVHRALRTADQLSGVLGALGVVVLGAALLQLRRSAPAWPLFLIAAVLLVPCFLLTICSYGMHHSRGWAPRLARRVSVAVLLLPALTLIVLAMLHIQIWPAFPLIPWVLLLPPMLLAGSLVRDLPVMIRLCAGVGARG